VKTSESPNYGYYQRYHSHYQHQPRHNDRRQGRNRILAAVEKDDLLAMARQLSDDIVLVRRQLESKVDYAAHFAADPAAKQVGSPHIVPVYSRSPARVVQTSSDLKNCLRAGRDLEDYCLAQLCCSHAFPKRSGRVAD
jgi:hypothetical protein